MFARAVECLFFDWVPFVALVWLLEFLFFSRFLP